MGNDSKNPKSGGKAKKNSPKKISLKPYSMHDSDKSTNASNSIAVPVDNDLGINHSLVNGQSALVSAGVVDCVPACPGSGGELLALDARDQIDLVSSQIDVIPTADQSILLLQKSEAEALALFQATLDESRPMSAPIVNFEVADLISSFLNEMKWSTVGGKLKKLRKKKAKKGAVANATSVLDEDFFD